MPGELPGLCATATIIAITAWHSGMFARRFGRNLGMNILYPRNYALTRTPDNTAPKAPTSAASDFFARGI